MLLWAVVGVVLIGVVLLDAFETIVLPRRATRRLRLARLVPRSLWRLWSGPRGDPGAAASNRETYLSFYGPSALFLLIGVWITGLIGGFALLLLGLGTPLVATGGDAGFGTAMYGSGTTFFTLGLGDVLPPTALGRLLVVLEAGWGSPSSRSSSRICRCSTKPSRSARSTCPCSTHAPARPRARPNCSGAMLARTLPWP